MLLCWLICGVLCKFKSAHREDLVGMQQWHGLRTKLGVWREVGTQRGSCWDATVAWSAHKAWSLEGNLLILIEFAT
jgi:hypothetical protein